MLACKIEGFYELAGAGLDKPQDYLKQQHLMPSLLAGKHPLAEVIEIFKAGFSQVSMVGRSLRVWSVASDLFLTKHRKFIDPIPSVSAKDETLLS